MGNEESAQKREPIPQLIDLQRLPNGEEQMVCNLSTLQERADENNKPQIENRSIVTPQKSKKPRRASKIDSDIIILKKNQQNHNSQRSLEEEPRTANRRASNGEIAVIEFNEQNHEPTNGSSKNLKPKKFRTSQFNPHQ